MKKKWLAGMRAKTIALAIVLMSLIHGSPAHAQADSTRARIVNDLLIFRTQRLLDSTQLDRCSVNKFIGSPNADVEVVLWALRDIIDRRDNCADRTARVALKRIVIDSVIATTDKITLFTTYDNSVHSYMEKYVGANLGKGGWRIDEAVRYGFFNNPHAPPLPSLLRDKLTRDTIRDR